MTAASIDQEPVTLVVAEVYGTGAGVWQGEGPSAGRACTFIRLGGCNLTCGWARGPGGLERVDGAWACDEAFTWHPGHGMRGRLARTPVETLIAAVDGPRLTVITGGEPLIHQDQPGWNVLLAGLIAAGHDIEVETNGTIIPAAAHKRIRHNVSPKLASSGLPAAARLIPPALRWHASRGSLFKFVVTGPADVAEAGQVAQLAGMPPHRVWIMPEGETADRTLTVARAVVAATAAAGYNLTLRQQVLLYEQAGEPRG